MTTDVQIIPAILATTEEEYKQQLEKIERSGLFDKEWVQIDFADGKFVQNKTIDTEVLAKYPTSLKKEAHLMVSDPGSWVDKLMVTRVDRIIFPFEVQEEEIYEMLATLSGKEFQVGISLNPETEVDKIKNDFIESVDMVLVMSVHPGFEGQKFMPEVLHKIKQLKARRQDLIVGVDGGISAENAKLVVEAGADYLVVGSHLIDGNISENLEKIRRSIRG